MNPRPLNFAMPIFASYFRALTSVIWSDSEQAIADLERLRQRGATHLVFTTNTFWWLESYPEFAQHLAESATLIQATSEFRIYKLATVTK